MFLKSIEIRGFKSFANRTELKLTKGITAIVGPNGSGKSNISDAVKWVLGEQSVKNLRGGRMEDVIFSGTQFRKPLGLCQVSLTLDNEDKSLPIEYSSVTVLRRLYRSGESEYYINNTKCRLKDINELFMDTGIGKEGYSIIGQGRIDAILSGRPEERRGILEEAAGIVKFRSRKEEAEKKLKNTGENLTRIQDILSTYAERLEPLKYENEKASEFLKLSEGLKEKEINMIVNSMDNAKIKIDDINKKINTAKAEMERLNSRYSVIKKDVDKFTGEIERLDEKRTFIEKSRYDFVSKLQKLDSDINILKEKISSANSTIEKNIREHEILKNKLADINNQKNILMKDISKFKKIQNELSSSIEDKNNILNDFMKNATGRDGLIKTLKDNQIEYLSSISGIKNKISSLKENIAKTQEKKEYVEGICVDYENSIKINLATMTKFKLEIMEIQETIENRNNLIEENKKKISELKRCFKKSSQELKKLNGEYMRLTAGCSMLLNLEKQHEGYNRASKILMGNIASRKVKVPENSCFIFGDIITVDKQFETAVEIALGASISNIITKDEVIAKNLIKHLKSNNIGRATFLPLNIIKGRKASISTRACGMDGYLGILSDIVAYDDCFKNAVESVLGRTVVARDIDSALAIAKLLNYSVRIVTLSGDVVNAGGSLTGGSRKSHSSGIIGRKREIDEMKKKIKSVEETSKNLKIEIDVEESKLQELDASNLDLKDEVYSKSIDAAKFREKLKNMENENVKLKKSVDVSKSEVLSSKLEIENLNSECMESMRKLDDVKKQKDDGEKKILEIEYEIKNKNKSIDNFKNELTNARIKKAKIDEGLSNKMVLEERLNADKNEIESKIARIEKENSGLAESKKEFLERIEKNKLQISGIDKNTREFEKDMDVLNAERIKINQRVSELNEQSVSLSSSIKQKEEDIHKFEISLARECAESENLGARLESDFEISYEEALEYKSHIEDVNKFKSEIQDLKKRISKIGSVNLGAIEEYGLIKQKVDFMTSQKDDLEEGTVELKKVIEEMTKKMKVLFKENFNRLRGSFNETFRELFKGGSADLMIASGDELTGNIDITVQPPGKKLQNINLMSGGEKGLSAIALLFAVLKMKPTPFCILDEIEAALDDVNVLRYAEFLKKFSQRTQFIVVTHRKGTMEAGDVMYGVTMEEKGVSKIVSVDLDGRFS